MCPTEYSFVVVVLMALFKDIRDKLQSEVAVCSALRAAGVDARNAVSVADLVDGIHRRNECVVIVGTSAVS